MTTCRLASSTFLASHTLPLAQRPYPFHIFLFWQLTPKGGDGAHSAGPKKWGGREAMASVELRWRLGRYRARGRARDVGLPVKFHIECANLWFFSGRCQSIARMRTTRSRRPSSASVVKYSRRASGGPSTGIGKFFLCCVVEP